MIYWRLEELKNGCRDLCFGFSKQPWVLFFWKPPAERAYELREWAFHRERLLIEENYHWLIHENIDKALEVDLAGVGAYPRGHLFHNFLLIDYEDVSGESSKIPARCPKWTVRIQAICLFWQTTRLVSRPQVRE